jgi:acrylyl-CoA reductase (NADPH)
MHFRAVRVADDGEGPKGRLTTMVLDELSPGDVVVRVGHSSLNYKDALAVTGRGRIMRRLPLNAGIDLGGVVETSNDTALAPGTAVIANGMGLGEVHDGGFAEYARVPAAWLIPLPSGLTLRTAMALGTAGYTAALALQRMEVNGQRPEMGAIVVTGATGGVGSIALQLLVKRGYRVIAVSGRPEHHAWLRALGAHEVASVDDLQLSGKPLDKARYGGAIDNVGGELLSRLLPHIVEWGNVVSVGLAGGADVRATVHPFILRGVSLLGASSANSPMPLRREIWRRLGADLRIDDIEQCLTKEIGLEEIAASAGDLLARRLTGRTVVTAGPSRA